MDEEIYRVLIGLVKYFLSQPDGRLRHDGVGVAKNALELLLDLGVVVKVTENHYQWVDLNR